MRSVIFTVFVLGSYLSNAVYAQAGYYGRNTIIEFGVLGRNPLVANLDGNNVSYFKNYVNKDGRLVQQKNKFDYGYSAGIYFLSNRTASFGIYGSIYNTNVPGLFGYNYSSNVQVQAMEQFRYTTYSFIPTLSLSANQLIKPVGISSEIGLGYTSAKLKQQDYLYSTTSNYKEVVDSMYQNGMLYDRKAKYSAVVAMFGLKMRQPLSKRLLLYYGLRYTVHFGFKQDRSDTPAKSSFPFYAYNDYTTHALRRNFINFQAGLCFTL